MDFHRAASSSKGLKGRADVTIFNSVPSDSELSAALVGEVIAEEKVSWGKHCAWHGVNLVKSKYR